MRRLLAEWLYPEAFRNERAYQRLLTKASDAFWWLGEFPEACATLRWIVDNERDDRRDFQTTMPICMWRQNISDFREMLRRGEHIEAQAKNRWQLTLTRSEDHSLSEPSS